jgi:hypothetical protein
VDQALGIIIPHFPNEVQGVLGNAEVTIDDLLMLARQSETSLRGWLIYTDIITGAIKSKQDTETTIEAEVAEIGIYTGSATGVEGSI